MINSERIVPVTATDLLSLYATIFAFSGGPDGVMKKFDAYDDQGDFRATETQVESMGICSEPVRTFDIGAAVTALFFAFIPAYDYKGFTVAGEAITPEGAVEADGRTLYIARYAEETLTITKMGF